MNKGKMKVIGARCTIVTSSEEAKNNVEAQSLATEIAETIKSSKDLHFSVKAKNEELLTTKKETKKWAALAVNSAVSSLLILESLKPTAEANPKALATKSNFKAMKVGAFMEQAKIIGNQLKNKSSELLAKGYKQEQIDELTTNTLKMQLSIDKEAALGVELNQLRNKCKMLEPTINGKFNTLNSMVVVNKTLMPTLYNDYFAVKMGKNKTSHMTIEGSITCNGQPLANASIKILSTVEVKPKSSLKAVADGSTVTTEKVIADKLSNIKGEFTTAKLKSGTYKAIIAKNGHTSQEVTLFVNPKETTKVNVSLDKLEVFNN